MKDLIEIMNRTILSHNHRSFEIYGIYCANRPLFRRDRKSMETKKEQTGQDCEIHARKWTKWKGERGIVMRSDERGKI